MGNTFKTAFLLTALTLLLMMIGRAFGGQNGMMIALAVAVTLRCDGCITVHTEAAIKHGASREEIAEALSVAVSVNAGPALVYSPRVMDAYEVNPASAAAASK